MKIDADITKLAVDKFTFGGTSGVPPTLLIQAAAADVRERSTGGSRYNFLARHVKRGYATLQILQAAKRDRLAGASCRDKLTARLYEFPENIDAAIWMIERQSVRNAGAWDVA